MGRDPAPDEPAWGDLREALLAARHGPLVYVVGDTDTGKTTLCRRLAADLAERWRTVRVDADPGQSTLGPPACVSAARFDDDAPLAVRFVGDVTPERHLLPLVTGVARLVARAREDGAEAVVVDSSGFATRGAAREFQYQLVDLLRPDHVAALQRRRELEPLLQAFARRRRVACHRLPAAPAARRRSRAERRRRRADRFAAHLAGAREQRIDLRGLGLHGHVPPADDAGRWRRLLAAAVDPDGFVLALGVVTAVAPHRWLDLLAPPFEPAAVASLAIGGDAWRRLAGEAPP